ncbi:hypothetical protein PR048_018019 [Dryococelus australis]|uniref:DUF4817 domain-containing protein n=1 Tax=Dryococelus australis TaxID=614101 RepID=A0ABQ9HB36_9NEOP|nr:hypothetical protein PR048_018019 [Dryococelus australis]
MVDLYTKMLLIYGEARRNVREACRLQQHYPNMRHPAHHTMFPRLERRLRQTGSSRPSKHLCGRPQTCSTPEFEETVRRESLQRFDMT